MEKQKPKHLDKMVLYLFLVVFLLSATVFAYRYSSYIPCEEVIFTINPKSLRAEQSIVFTDITEGAENWQWTFGEDENSKNRKKVTYKYNKPGDYKVKLVVNGVCEREEIITIGEKIIIRDSTKYPNFNIPKSIFVGNKIKVKDETENATSWEWRFGEKPGIDSNEKEAEYVYEEPGKKTISLIVNGNIEYMSSKEITVFPKQKKNIKISPILEDNLEEDSFIKDRPVENNKKTIKDQPKEVPYITEPNFKLKIMLISNEKIKPQELTDYFCGDINKTILVNGNNITFLEFCHKISGKKIKIKKLNIIRSDGSNCINNLTIDYKKDWF